MSSQSPRTLLNSWRVPSRPVACLLALFASMWFGEPALMESNDPELTAQRSFPSSIAGNRVTNVNAGNQTFSHFTLPNTVTPLAATATYDSVLKAPKCGSLDSSCDSGTLLNGRDNIFGGAEPNQPNTINNSCADGTSGAYHSDESIDAIKVSTVDGRNFAPGKPIKIEVTVWPYSGDPTSDHVDLYYATNANSPTWNYISTLTPSTTGLQVLSTTHTLAFGAPFQAVRARFRYLGAPTSCGANSGYDDYDDLIFGVWDEATVSGQITNGTGGGLSGKTVTLTGSAGTFTSLPSDGNGYSLTVPQGYNYTATANGAPGEFFVRWGTSNSALTSLSGDVTGFNFAMNVPQYTAAGTITINGGGSLTGVTVFPSAQNHLPGGPTQCTGPNGQGSFSCNGLWQGTSYSIVPYKENYVFDPPSIGVSGNIFNLQFSGAPGATVTTTNATSITATTATLNGSVNPQGVATSVWFEWGTDSTLAIHNVMPPTPQPMGSGNIDLPFSQNLPGLIGSTTYYFRAVASNPSITVKGAIVPFTTGTADYDAVFKAPKCGSPSNECNSGTLLNGRDSLAGGSEPNQPNTINNSCADGTGGVYHSDESIEAIRVSTFDNGNFSPGKYVSVEVTLWAFSDFDRDHLDLYYAADASNPNWVYLDTLEPYTAGYQVLYGSYALPIGGDMQAVRARFRYNGAASPCGSSSNFEDHDDLVFTVEQPPGGTVQFSGATYSQTEDGGTATITVTRTGASSGAASVQFLNPTGGSATGGGSCVAGIDYVTPSGSLNWANGETGAKTFPVTLCNENLVENNESLNLALSNATGAILGNQTTATLTITNEDTDVSVAVAPASVTEDGASNLVYTFTRGGVTNGPLTVNFSVGGTADFNTDYTQSGAATFTASSGTVTFGAGNLTANVTIDPTVDTTIESDETAILTVTSGTGYTVVSPSAATGTITTDDTDVTVSVAPASVAEDGATNLVHTFTRNGFTSGALTVNFSVGGTATLNTDYTQIGAATFTASSGTVTFGAGSSTATVTIDPAVDSAVESDETVILTVTTGSGYHVAIPSAATGTITNDDVGALSINTVAPKAGRTSGGQQIQLTGNFPGLSTVTMGGTSATWSYTNGAGDISAITITTPVHAAGAVQIDLTPSSGTPYSKANAFAYLPTVFTDDTLTAGVTVIKAQHIIELRQAVDAMRAVAGLSGAPWTDPALATGDRIKAIHVVELRTYLDNAATLLGYSTSPYTDPSLAPGYTIKRIHIEELRQRIRVIAQ